MISLACYIYSNNNPCLHAAGYNHIVATDLSLQALSRCYTIDYSFEIASNGYDRLFIAHGLVPTNQLKDNKRLHYKCTTSVCGTEQTGGIIAHIK